MILAGALIALGVTLAARRIRAGDGIKGAAAAWAKTGLPKWALFPLKALMPGIAFALVLATVLAVAVAHELRH